MMQVHTSRTGSVSWEILRQTSHFQIWPSSEKHTTAESSIHHVDPWLLIYAKRWSNRAMWKTGSHVLYGVLNSSEASMMAPKGCLLPRTKALENIRQPLVSACPIALRYVHSPDDSRGWWLAGFYTPKRLSRTGRHGQ